MPSSSPRSWSSVGGRPTGSASGGCSLSVSASSHSDRRCAGWHRRSLSSSSDGSSRGPGPLPCCRLRSGCSSRPSGRSADRRWWPSGAGSAPWRWRPAPHWAPRSITAGGWRWAFFVNLPVGVIAYVTGRRVLVAHRADTGRPRPDYLGAVLMSTSLAALVLGISEGPTWGWTSPRVVLPSSGR